MPVLSHINFPPPVYASHDVTACDAACSPRDTVCKSRCRTDHGGSSGTFPVISITDPGNVPDSFDSVGGVVGRIFGAAITIAAIVAFVFLIWGGIQWITSGGDKTGLENARNRITNAIIGLVIVVAAWAIFQLVQIVFFGGESTLLKLGA